MPFWNEFLGIWFNSLGFIFNMPNNYFKVITKRKLYILVMLLKLLERGENNIQIFSGG